MKLKLLAIIPLVLMLAGCPKPEQDARDAGAGLNGAIAAAQSKYQTSCAANSAQAICSTINQAVSAQNALITATEAYCGWSTLNPPQNQNQVCVPVKSAQSALQTAIANANTFITQLKGAL